MTTRAPDNQLGLSTAQAARELGVSLSTVRRWADQGHLTSIRTPGGQRRFPRDAIERFVTSLHQGPHDRRPGD